MTEDMNTFEHEVATELGQMAGLGRRIDAMAMVRTVTTESPKRRFQSMFSATKFVVAGVIVALFGGFLLAGVLTQPSDDSLPAAVSSASTEPDASEAAAPTTEATSTPDNTTTTDLLPGTFTAAGSLAEGRLGFTATLLQDGRVLVVGGSRGGSDHRVAPAEIWDPATATFSPAGALTDARDRHTATLLSDGRVLVVGGLDGDRRLASAEIWDPATTTFSPAGSLARPRNGHTATALPDGRLLVIGGWRDRQGDKFTTSAEIWDPATESFSSAGSHPGVGWGHSVTLLPDGRVFVVGGIRQTESGRRFFKSAEVWGPATASFEPAGSLAKGRAFHSATLLPDGRVLFVGGGNSFDKVVASAEVWDPVTGSFSPAGTLAEARGENFTATLLPDGRVLVVGGAVDVTGATDDVEIVKLASAEVWDPVTGSFGPAGSLAEARSRHSATLLPDGRVLVVGFGGRTARPTSAEIWDPVTGSFGPAVSSTEERGGSYTATQLPDGRILVIGGWDEDYEPLASAEVWSP